MPVSTIDDLPAAGPLVGTEPIETVQGGVSKRTTAQDIADLGGGGGGAAPLTVYAADATMAANAIAVANFANAGGSAGAPITISLPAAPADGDICEVWSYDPDASGELPRVGRQRKQHHGAGRLVPRARPVRVEFLFRSFRRRLKCVALPPGILINWLEQLP
jgi:hypothetical protein